jgi:hypothetical protein
MRSEFPSSATRIIAAAKILMNSAHAKTISAAAVALLSASVFLLKTCSDPEPDTGEITGRAQSVVDQIRDAREAVSPPDESEIERDVENEIRSAQDDDSFFMDAPETE